MLLRRLFATFIVTTTLSPLHAGFLTNGSLNVTIRDDNGAIDSVVFGGTEFF